MGQVYRCWWRICPEINVFPRFEYHMFYVLYSFIIYLLTVPHIYHLMNTVFWHVIPCPLVLIRRLCRRTCSLHLHSRRINQASLLVASFWLLAWLTLRLWRWKQ
jgi:hypothetical protein